MQTLDEFLISVERKAFRMAQLAVKNEADALDIVQDSMISLAQSYGQWQGNEQSRQWRPLFYRILQNRIMNHHRRQSRWQRWFTPVLRQQNNDQGLSENISQNLDFSPEDYINQQQLGDKVLAAVEKLPLQQQQCFLLRNWEGFSVQETADLLNISPGSVKTHHHRATQKLQQVLHEES